MNENYIPFYSAQRFGRIYMISQYKHINFANSNDGSPALGAEENLSSALFKGGDFPTFTTNIETSSLGAKVDIYTNNLLALYYYNRLRDLFCKYKINSQSSQSLDLKIENMLS